jgi:hypothetical protein
MGEKYQIHPLAETYPPMSEAEMEALTADIAARGLQRPIVLYEGKVLDGRNRYLACQRANVEPHFEEYKGDDPLGEVYSLNLNRDLTAGQRAMVAARQWGLKEYSKGGRPSNGKPLKSLEVSLPVLAKKHRTSQPSIIAARDLLAGAPDLAMLVDTCVRSLAFATEELEGRRAQARKQSQDAEKASRFSAEYREIISDGKATPEEALEEIFRREREERERLRLNAEARQLWFDVLADVVKSVKERVASRTDDELAWYREGIVAGESNAVTLEQVRETVAQLQRIESITLRESANGSVAEGRGSRSQKGRESGV